MPANNRIYYATQAVILEPCDAEGKNQTKTYVPQGLQSVGMTTNFALEQVFQLGQLDLYDNLENVPEVEVTMSKVLDGTPPLYLMCMGGTAGIAGASDKELAEVSTNRVHFNLNIYADTNTAASGTAVSAVKCSGMYLSSINYTFPTEGNSTEEITLVGNNKLWGSPTAINEFTPSTANGVTTGPSAPSVVRRQYVNISGSSLPTGSGGFPVNSRISNINISSNLGREAIFELGRMAPYFRYVNFPVEVTSEFEVIALSGDYVNADDFSTLGGCGASKSNVFDKTIKILVCGSGTGNQMSIDLGGKNKLTSVNYTGGDTGGGNASMTYSFQTFNKLKVIASGTFLGESSVDNTADTENYR
jgi:hypothetical protein